MGPLKIDKNMPGVTSYIPKNFIYLIYDIYFYDYLYMLLQRFTGIRAL